MKLAVISHLASPHAPTGAEKSLAQLVDGLSERGHEIAVVVPGPWCLEGAVRGSGAEVVEIASRGCWLVQAGQQPLWKQALRYARFRAPDPGFRRMMVWLDRFWPDVVYVNCLPQLKGAAAARALGLPVVWHIREILPPSGRRSWFARRLRRDASRIVAVSQAVADWLVEEGLEDRVDVVHNGCPIRPRSGSTAAIRAELGLPGASVLVGFFAQMIDHKGVFDLFSAGIRAMEDDPSLGVVFAGDGPARDRLQAEIRDSPHPDRFFVLQPQKEVWDLLAAVDMVAVPSLWPDPLPRTVMEAMSAGLPVVAYRTGGVPEMVIEGETGLLAETGNIAQLTENILLLSGDRDLRDRMGAAARDRAREDFSLDAHTDSMEQVFMRIVRTGRWG